MSPHPVQARSAAMRRLQQAERERHEAIAELVALGVIRSHVLVGDLGEAIAARYYGVELLPQFTPGHDLIDQAGRRIDVKTLRSTPERPRTVIGSIGEPCDILMAIRLSFDYSPLEALEIPRDVAELHTGKNGKISWTRKLAAHPGVLFISNEQLA